MSGLKIITPNNNIKKGSKWSGHFAINEATAEYVGTKSYRDTIDGTGGFYPTSGGSGTGGDILAGDYWVVDTGGGTIGDKTVSVGDTLLALVDDPVSADANWCHIIPVDVTTDDWILTFENNGQTVIELSTDNGLLSTTDNKIEYELSAAVTTNLNPQLVYGELRNETTKKTFFGIKTAIEGSPNG